MSKSGGLGDIAGARLHETNIVTHAAVASGGANARLGQFGPYPYDIRPRNVFWSPLSADQAATQSASYRRLSLYNGGSAGTSTATASRMASLNVSVTVASLGATQLVVDTTQSMASGQIAYFSQETVGAADANGTVLSSGQFSLSYEII